MSTIVTPRRLLVAVTIAALTGVSAFVGGFAMPPALGLAIATGLTFLLSGYSLGRVASATDSAHEQLLKLWASQQSDNARLMSLERSAEGREQQISSLLGTLQGLTHTVDGLAVSPKPAAIVPTTQPPEPVSWLNDTPTAMPGTHHFANAVSAPSPAQPVHVADGGVQDQITRQSTQLDAIATQIEFLQDTVLALQLNIAQSNIAMHNAMERASKNKTQKETSATGKPEHAQSTLPPPNRKETSETDDEAYFSPERT